MLSSKGFSKLFKVPERLAHRILDFVVPHIIMTVIFVSFDEIDGYTHKCHITTFICKINMDISTNVIIFDAHVKIK